MSRKQVSFTDKRTPVIVAKDEGKVDRRKHPKVNDRPKPATDVFSQAVVRESLKGILEHYGFKVDDIHVDDLKDIAKRLSELVGKEPAWGWAYLRNVLNQKLDASAKLTDAIMRLGALIDGAPKVQVTSQRVTVLAVGNVRPGALVLGSSQPCGRLACPVHFVPTHPRQKYCSRECAGSAQRLKRMERLAAGRAAGGSFGDAEGGGK